MPRTKIWRSFGNHISDHPELTLLSFLGDPSAIAVAQQRQIRFPTLINFKADSAYDPNPFNLNLDFEWVRTKQLLLCLMTWGPELVKHVTLECAQLQECEEISGRPDLSLLEREILELLRQYVKNPVKATMKKLAKKTGKCEEIYAPYADNPDDPHGLYIWHRLAAPWFASRVHTNDWSLQVYDGALPREAQSTWILRNSVFPSYVAEGAAYWTSY
ncbi:MAG: hypothetical protein AAFO61_08960, partial [Pseudomonadota bacterium]